MTAWSRDLVDVDREQAPFGRSLPLRYNRDDVEVITLHESARSRIQLEAEQSSDGFEYGGPLFRHVASRDEAAIDEALGAGPLARHTMNSVRFDFESISRVERELRAARSDLIRCGSWHTHPRGRTDPSKPDLELAREDFEELEREKLGDDAGLWVMLIVTASAEPLFRWRAGIGQEIHPYALYRRASGRLEWSRAQIRKVD